MTKRVFSLTLCVFLTSSWRNKGFTVSTVHCNSEDWGVGQRNKGFRLRFWGSSFRRMVDPKTCVVHVDSTPGPPSGDLGTVVTVWGLGVGEDEGGVRRSGRRDREVRVVATDGPVSLSDDEGPVMTRPVTGLVSSPEGREVSSPSRVHPPARTERLSRRPLETWTRLWQGPRPPSV